jgi:hypothetical protein
MTPLPFIGRRQQSKIYYFVYGSAESPEWAVLNAIPEKDQFRATVIDYQGPTGVRAGVDSRTF